jgi:hypothetical protein
MYLSKTIVENAVNSKDHTKSGNGKAMLKMVEGGDLTVEETTSGRLDGRNSSACVFAGRSRLPCHAGQTNLAWAFQVRRPIVRAAFLPSDRA